MVKSCCIEGCDFASPDVEYFMFPRSGALLAAWVEATGAPGGEVCSAHFTDDDYKSMRGKRRLLGTAVPSVFASKPQPTENGDIASINSIKDTKKNLKRSSDSTKDKTKKIKEGPKAKRAKIKKVTNKAKADSATDDDTDATENKDDRMAGLEKNDESTTDTDVTEKTNIGNRESSQDTSDTRQGSSEDSGKYNKREIPPSEVNDIEDMITPYQIKQPPLADRLNPDPLEDLIPAILERQANMPEVPVVQEHPEVSITEVTEASRNKLDVNQLASHLSNKLDDQISQIMAAAPVFIEVAVDQNTTRSESPQDCVMLLESVQCDIDPSSLMLPEHGPDTDSDMEIVETETEIDTKIKEDPNPISLLTSSDEDEVIIEEPHIDTVEVSDETDEDDRPLQRLVKGKSKKKSEKKKKKKYPKISLGNFLPFYCVQCDFKTHDPTEFKRHNLQFVHLHSTTIHVCPTCNYSTASSAQFSRHKRKHKDERNFKCHLCNYKARHSMSLIYHIRCHDSGEKKPEKFTCDKCGFSSNVKSEALQHVKSKKCDPSKYGCDHCSYSTKRRSDLRRHRRVRHSVEDSDEDFSI